MKNRMYTINVHTFQELERIQKLADYYHSIN